MYTDRLDTLIPLTEVRRRLSVSKTTVWKLIRRGTLKPIRVGRAVRVRLSEVQFLIDGGTLGSGGAS
jgi:excisionase family DNA binding protein